MASPHDDPALETLTALDAAWRTVGHGARHRAVLRGACEIRERFDSSSCVVAVRTLQLTTLAYPTRHAFWGAAFNPLPYVALAHRCLLVQFLQRGALKNLLFNPSDVVGARRTPFFARNIERYGAAAELLARSSPALEAQLALLGLAPGDVDYVAFDHFHTQDLRGLLGTADGRLAQRFPNATLLAPRNEWDQWTDLHPMQQAWFVADGREGVREERVHFTEGDLWLGEGLALLRTPGHTAGNQTLFLKTPRGVWGVCENGVCADNWSPLHSRIPGLARIARTQGLDVLLNANTPEGGAEQYTSMALEKALVDRVPESPEFCQLLSSSECIPAAFAPGLAPTLSHGAIHCGLVQLR